MGKLENNTYIGYSDAKEEHEGLQEGVSISTGSICFFILLGIAIAVRDNGAKWKHAVINFYSNLFHHPLQIFHFETWVYLFVTFLFIRLVLGTLKRIF